MLGFAEHLGFPPPPIAAAIVVVCAVIWGLQSRRKRRAHLLALQVSLVSCLLSTLAMILQGDVVGISEVIAAILRITFGQILTFWGMSWLIISLIFVIRSRNDSANIFTRNRN